MSSPPLNVEYWASLYPVYTEYAAAYDEAVSQDRFVDQAEALWEWKGLNRSIPFDDIRPVLEQLSPSEYVDRAPRAAVEALLGRLLEADILDTERIVTPAFLLHLMASESEQYSTQFPIYDRRVWNAYVYLCGHRGDGQQLYHDASTDSERYGQFCEHFRVSCPDGQPRAYERALFMFGGFIEDIPSADSRTPIENIDATIRKQEAALGTSEDSWMLVDMDRVRRARR